MTPVVPPEGPVIAGPAGPLPEPLSGAGTLASPPGPVSGALSSASVSGAPASAPVSGALSFASVSGAERALDAACDHLLGLRSPQGWWKGELQTNVTMDAEDLLLREFLGVRTAEDTSEAARWIRSQQRDDGTWATFHGGPGDLSTTVEAYAALRLAGDPSETSRMRAAAAFVRRAGGVEGTRVFTRIWLALFGQWPWEDLPVLPPELVFLPPWFPLNVYDWACWARQTIVPLTVVSAHRPVGGGPALLPRSGLDRARRLDGLADGLGADGPARRGGALGGGGTRGAVAGRAPAPRRHLGRTPVHRDRLSRRLLHQLPPLPAGLPDQRPGALPAPSPRGRGSAGGVVSGLLICAALGARRGPYGAACRRGRRGCGWSGPGSA